MSTTTPSPLDTETEPRLLDVNDLQILGLSELSKRWKISKQRVSEITEARCPHWRKLDCGRVWLLPDILAFEKKWQRTTGIHVTPRKRREDAYPEPE